MRHAVSLMAHHLPQSVTLTIQCEAAAITDFQSLRAVGMKLPSLVSSNNPHDEAFLGGKS